MGFMRGAVPLISLLCGAEWSQGLLDRGCALLPKQVTQMAEDSLPQQQIGEGSRPPQPTCNPPGPRPGYPAHLLQGEGEVGGLSSLTGLQQQLFLALAEQGDGA